MQWRSQGGWRVKGSYPPHPFLKKKKKFKEKLIIQYEHLFDEVVYHLKC